MFDIITIGDTTTDIFLEVDKATRLAGVDRENNRLWFNYASKIPVKYAHQAAGVGNAANVAVGTARLGLKTAIYTIIGKDDAGKEIQKQFRKEKIAQPYVRVDSRKDTNVSIVIDYKADRTILVHHQECVYKLPRWPRPKWIYFSSICGNHDQFNQELRAYVVKNNAKLGFNPGSMQLRLGARRLKLILSVAEVVFVNVQEAEQITRRTSNIKTLLKLMKRTGPRMVAITDGRKGSYCYDGERMYQIGIIDLPVVERTGCGDAYASGFLSALAYGLGVTEAMRWGSVNGAHEATKLGSQTGLLNRKRLELFLRQHSKFQPQVI